MISQLRIGMGLGLFALVLSSAASAMSIDEYLASVKKNNKSIAAAYESIEAAGFRREAGDLSLSPQLTASVLNSEDKSLPSQQGDTRRFTDYSLGVAKKFSSGTSVSLSAKTTDFNNQGSTNPATTEYTTAGLGVSLQQSLWKDGFGRATRLRQTRESYVEKVEKWAAELKLRGLLIEAESIYWDYAISQEDVKLKQENLDRAKKLDRWTGNRVSNGISDRSDLMNVKALASLRELELQNSQEELRNQETKIKTMLELASSDPAPKVTSSFSEARPFMKTSAQNKMIKIESVLAVYEAKTKQKVAEEVTEGLRPDLSLVGSYFTSAYNLDRQEALSDISKTDYPKTTVGLTLTWLFGSDAKSSSIAASQKDATASKLTAEKKIREGQEAWATHLRQFKLAQENVKTLEQIYNYQKERAKVEQDKFSKGRTITANVVNAETDSAQAEVNYLKAKSGLRKLEAATQLYVPEEEGQL